MSKHCFTNDAVFPWQAEPPVETWGADLVASCPHYMAQATADRRMTGEGSQSTDIRCFQRAFPTSSGIVTPLSKYQTIVTGRYGFSVIP